MTTRILLLLSLLLAAPAAAKSTPEEALAGLSTERLADVEAARVGLLEAERQIVLKQDAISGAKLRLQAAKKDQAAAKLSHKARDFDLRAAEADHNTAASDEATLRRGEAEIATRWRAVGVDAAKTDLALAKQRLTHARKLLALRQTELERHKLDALADTSDDSSIDKQLGRASAAVARLRNTADSVDRKAMKLDDKLAAQRDEAATLQEQAGTSVANAERARLLQEIEALTVIAKHAEELRAQLAESEKARADSDALRLRSELSLERLRVVLAENQLADPTQTSEGSEPAPPYEEAASDAP